MAKPSDRRSCIPLDGPPAGLLKSIALVCVALFVHDNERWLPFFFFHHLKMTNKTRRMTAKPAIEPTTLPITTGVGVVPPLELLALPESEVLAGALEEITPVAAAPESAPTTAVLLVDHGVEVVGISEVSEGEELETDVVEERYVNEVD